MNQTDQVLPSKGHAPHLEALVGQVALRMTAHLSRAAADLPHDITERLRYGRERALAQRRKILAPVAAVPMVVMAGRAAALGGPPSVWLRLASLLPLAVLTAGLVFIQHYHEWQQIETAAEIDSALLADDLPPAAYGDPGFSEFLRTAVQP